MMAFRKQYLIMGVAILWPILSFKSCQAKEKRHWMSFFPPPITIEKMLVYQTGCDYLFSCAGGVLLELGDTDAATIKSGGLSYLNSLPRTAVNGYPISDWRVVDRDEDMRLYYARTDGEKHKTRLHEALRQETCYRSNGHPILVLCPEVGLAYAGWFD